VTEVDTLTQVHAEIQTLSEQQVLDIIRLIRQGMAHNDLPALTAESVSTKYGIGTDAVLKMIRAVPWPDRVAGETAQVAQED